MCADGRNRWGHMQNDVTEKRESAREHYTKAVGRWSDRILAYSDRLKEREKFGDGEEELLYESLSPVSTISNDSEYLKALKWALNNENTANIGLTGSFGSGKSSIIKSLLANNPDIKRKSICVSLATFFDAKPAEAEDENAGITHKVTKSRDEIEQGILRQIFYAVNQKEIPQSRYRKIKKVSRVPFFLQFLFVLFLLLGFSYLAAPEVLSGMLRNLTGLGRILGISVATVWILFAVVALLALWYIGGKLYGFVTQFSIREINISHQKVSASLATSETVFDKYMDELVYFFEATPYRVVFFEDLDRLDNTEIFIHLRELNGLLNQSKTLKNRITFVYAVRDDIFNDAERTKFFDFIIPVIPYMTATNSGDILLRKVEEAKSRGKDFRLSEEYILDISPFLSNMRILQNICNEFVAYLEIFHAENRKGGTEETGDPESQGLRLKHELLFSLLMFKNLHPKDFSKLQRGSGIVPEAFRQKERYLKKRAAELDAEIDRLEEEQNRYQADLPKKIRECKLLFLNALAEELPDETRENKTVVGLGLNRKQADLTLEQFLEDRFSLKELLKAEELFVQYRYGVRLETIGDATVSDSGRLVETYLKKEQNLRYVADLGAEELEEAMEETQKARERLETLSMKEVLSARDADPKEIFSDERITRNLLLVFLLRRGYLDETYPLYINYFIGKSITVEDQNFILSVKNRTPLPYYHPITFPKRVAERLQSYEFQQKEIFNHDLLNYLLASAAEADLVSEIADPKGTREEGSEAEKLSMVFTALSDGSEESWNFIDQFVRVTDYRSPFIHILGSRWPGMWDAISRNHDLSYDRKVEYLRWMLGNLLPEQIVTANKNGSVVAFLEQYPDMLERLAPAEDTERCISLSLLEDTLVRLKVRFSDVLFRDADEELVRFVITQRLYRINPVMVNRVARFLDPSLDEEDLNRANYTVLQKADCEDLLDYLHGRVEAYVTEVILQEGNTGESPEAVSELLERIAGNTGLCRDLLVHEEAVFPDLSDCCGALLSGEPEKAEAIWNLLLLEGKTDLTEENLETYRKRFGETEIYQKIMGEAFPKR